MENLKQFQRAERRPSLFGVYSELHSVNNYRL
jgi:hypothetical protein